MTYVHVIWQPQCACVPLTHTNVQTHTQHHTTTSRQPTLHTGNSPWNILVHKRVQIVALHARANALGMQQQHHNHHRQQQQWQYSYHYYHYRVVRQVLLASACVCVCVCCTCIAKQLCNRCIFMRRSPIFFYILLLFSLVKWTYDISIERKILA